MVKYSVSLSMSSQEAFGLEHPKRTHFQNSTFKAVLDEQNQCFLQDLDFFALLQKQFAMSFSFFHCGSKGQ